RWVAKLQCPVGRVQNMAGHISQSTAAEVPPSTPFKWGIPGIVRTGWGWSQPDIPIKGVRHRFCRQGRSNPLRPDGTISPGMDFAHVADGARPDDFTQLAHSLT